MGIALRPQSIKNSNWQRTYSLCEGRINFINWMRKNSAVTAMSWLAKTNQSLLTSIDQLTLGNTL